jgi:apolipoprotein N-acyltransferase
MQIDRLSTAFILFAVMLVPLVRDYDIPEQEKLTAALIATDIPVGPAGGENRYIVVPAADIIVLPEEFRLNPPFADAHEKRVYFESLFHGRDVLVMSGNHVPAQNSPGYDIALLFDDESGTTLGTYMKRFLMPGGEYMPHAMLAVFQLAPDSGITRYLGSIPQIAPEPTDLVAVPFGNRTVGGLICSDFLSPQLNRALSTRHGANVLINSANPAWFHHSPILYTKTLQVSKTHAVQNRAYYLQASNGAPAFAIDPEGNVIAESAWRQTSVTRVEL